MMLCYVIFYFFFQAEDGIRDGHVTGVQTCALPILVYATLGSCPGTSSAQSPVTLDERWEGKDITPGQLLSKGSNARIRHHRFFEYVRHHPHRALSSCRPLVTRFNHTRLPLTETALYCPSICSISTS